MIEKESPYIAHVFVCTNDRGGTRKACADNDSPSVRAKLKERCEEKGWRGRVRVSMCGCMGLCEQGSNVIIYPQKIWLSAVSTKDIEDIVAIIERIVNEH